MKIMDLLTTIGVRVEYQDKWLVYDSTEWDVYMHRPYAKHTTRLYSGMDIEKAIETLLEVDK